MKPIFTTTLITIALLCSAADGPAPIGTIQGQLGYGNFDSSYGKQIVVADLNGNSVNGGIIVSAEGIKLMEQQADDAKRYEWLKKFYNYQSDTKSSCEIILYFKKDGTVRIFVVNLINSKNKSNGFTSDFTAPTLDAAIDKAIADKILEKADAAAKEAKATP